MKPAPLFAVALLLGLGACPGESPRPRTPTAQPSAAKPSTAQADRPVIAAAARPTTQPAPVAQATPAPEPAPPAPLDPADVLDDEERRLLAADDATLTRDERVARAYAQRKLVMADPDHPLRPAIVQLEEQVASGEYATMAHEMWSGRAAFPDREGELPGSP